MPAAQDVFHIHLAAQDSCFCCPLMFANDLLRKFTLMDFWGAKMR
jgi:hypothetical protein